MSKKISELTAAGAAPSNAALFEVSDPTSKSVLFSDIVASILAGNAATATKLLTARAINGVAFDGSAAITVTAAAGTLSGATLAAGVTASSLTSVGTLASLTVSGSLVATLTGAASLNVLKAGDTIGGLLTLSSSGISFNGSAQLLTEGSNSISLRNSTNAQSFFLYGTYTDSSNFNRIDIQHLGGTSGAVIKVSALGTGGVGPLQFAISKTAAAPTNIFNIATSGHLLWNTDNTYDIGASGANRPRVLYVGTGIEVPTYLRANALICSDGSTTSRVRITSDSDGVLKLQDNAASNFSRLQFGGTTSSFPALKRSAAGIDVRLADDSAYAALTSGNHTLAAAALLSITSGTNQRAGNATLVAGTVTVSNTTVTANTVVILTRKTSGGTIGTAITYTLSAGASFTITSDNILDTSVFSYLLIEVP